MTVDDLGTVLTAAPASLSPGGDLVAAHGRPPAPKDRRGDDVHDTLGTVDGPESVATYQDPGVRLDVFTRVPPAVRAVAQTNGLCR